MPWQSISSLLLGPHPQYFDFEPYHQHIYAAVEHRCSLFLNDPLTLSVCTSILPYTPFCLYLQCTKSIKFKSFWPFTFFPVSMSHPVPSMTQVGVESRASLWRVGVGSRSMNSTRKRFVAIHWIFCTFFPIAGLKILKPSCHSILSLYYFSPTFKATNRGKLLCLGPQVVNVYKCLFLYFCSRPLYLTACQYICLDPGWWH